MDIKFYERAGHIDGEIIKTLWSEMNKVSGAAKSMSKAYRQETLDDYIRDWNYKKTVGMSKSCISQDDFLFYIIFS